MTQNIAVSNLSPKEIVKKLDLYIIGQERAKRIVAIALRNRWRRANIDDEVLREEILPKNIMMAGPTGVGKTEIARRLAQIVDSPFIKVEATKFTEVGYVGRDVESMIKDLVKNAINICTKRELKAVRAKAEPLVNEILLDLLGIPNISDLDQNAEDYEDKRKRREDYRAKNLKKLLAGEFDDKIVSITVEGKPLPILEISSGMGGDDMDLSIKDMMGSIFPSNKKEKKVSVKEAAPMLIDIESQKMIDKESIQHEGLRWAEASGIVFIDEIDKIIGSSGGRGQDVSREGVQRDFLPIVEGSIVNTKYGQIKTDHILFIGAGAFHMNSPSDLIPELQGRFPLNVGLTSLTKNDFEKILTEPANSLIKQYRSLMETEGLKISFTEAAIEQIADISFDLNNSTQDIGARRLQMVLETIFEDLSFNVAEMKKKTLSIDVKYIKKSFREEISEEKLNKYII